MTPRKTCCELLESRQLLAGDLCLADVSTERIAESEGPSLTQIVSTLQTLNDPLAENSLTKPSLYLWPVDGYPWGDRDLVAEHAGLVAAVRPFEASPLRQTNGVAGTLHLFTRQSANNVVESASIELGFTAKRVIVTDRLIVVLGSDSELLDSAETRARTHVLAINRNDTTIRTPFLLSGHYTNVALNADRLFVSTSSAQDLVPAIYPPVLPTYRVTVIDLNGAVPRRVAAGPMPGAVTEPMIVGNDIIMTRSRLAVVNVDGTSDANNELLFAPVPTYVSSMVRYRINGDSISSVAELDLPSAMDMQVELAVDGKSAVIVGQAELYYPTVVGAPGGGVVVSLIDLYQDQPVLFQTITVETRERSPAFEIGRNAVVIADGPRQLITVDINQAIDIDALSRVRRINLASDSAELLSGTAVMIAELSNDVYLIARPSFTPDVNTGVLTSNAKMDLMTFSLNRQAVVAKTSLQGSLLAVFGEGHVSPALLDFWPFPLTGSAPLLATIAIDIDGGFGEASSIDLSGALEIDVDATRLLVRHVDHLTEYRWSQIDQPMVIPLGDPLPVAVAVDDVFRLNSESRDRYLNVLANDEFYVSLGQDRPQIVELIDAPASVSIAPGGDLLFLNENSVGAEGTFEFRYVIEQGAHRATASVLLTLFRFSRNDVQEVVRNVIVRAATDLGVAENEIEFVSQRVYSSVPMPAIQDSGATNSLGGQFGVVVELRYEGTLYQYAANFENEIVSLGNRTLRTVMSLQLRAVDGNGRVLESVRSGDEFYLEVVAQDLREFGQGVFAVAFDLPLPANRIETTGEVVPLGKFDEIGESIAPSGIDEFHAIEALIEHPGNEAQPVVRIGVRATAGGELDLQLDPAESLGAELLLRGIDTILSPAEVRFGGLRLQIGGVDPTDTDASGAVTPTDALRVINFLGLFGSVSIDELPNLAGLGEGESAEIKLQSMRRLDTNADGRISSIDALQVINELSRLFARANSEAEAVDRVLRGDWLTEEQLLF